MNITVSLSNRPGSSCVFYLPHYARHNMSSVAATCYNRQQTEPTPTYTTNLFILHVYGFY